VGKWILPNYWGLEYNHPILFSWDIMAAITSSAHLSPGAQMQQFGKGMSLLLQSVCESTDAAFRRVHLMKKDAAGNIKFYDKKEKIVDLATGERREVTRRVAELTYIEDVKSGDIYLDESRFDVAVKCALIALIMPFYVAARIGWHGAETFFQMSVVVVDMIADPRGFEAGRRCAQLSQELGEGLFKVAQASLFGSGCGLGAAYGIFKPYHGRRCVAILENAWLRGVSYKRDLRNIPARPNEDCLTACVKDVRTAEAFYLAYCFQLRGNVNEPRIVVIRRE
jgi:hypothetical protein